MQINHHTKDDDSLFTLFPPVFESEKEGPKPGNEKHLSRLMSTTPTSHCRCSWVCEMRQRPLSSFGCCSSTFLLVLYMLSLSLPCRFWCDDYIAQGLRSPTPCNTCIWRSRILGARVVACLTKCFNLNARGWTQRAARGCWVIQGCRLGGSLRSIFGFTVALTKKATVMMDCNRNYLQNVAPVSKKIRKLPKRINNISHTLAFSDQTE